jgi:L-ribulose-5-phosphate 3-epimerase
MTPRLPIAAITDEFSPNLAEAIPVMNEIGMTGAELRVIDGKNILDLSDDELRRAKDVLDEAGLQVVSIASPLLKCVIDAGTEPDERFHRDIFASKHTLGDQPRLTERAIGVSHFFGVRIIRVFSYWRTMEPRRYQERIAQALIDLTRLARQEDLVIALENEHACNVATGAETAAESHARCRSENCVGSSQRSSCRRETVPRRI